LPRYYHEADVFCSPAPYEGGVANVSLEAMACGCPVLASTAGGAPEAVTEGRTGLLVPPDDPDALVRALDRILSDAPLRRRMGRAAREKVEEYFAMDKYIRRVLAVYETAIERSRKTLDRLKVEKGL
jgi:glycosyltransferase involved in cell wall biosynthesis